MSRKFIGLVLASSLAITAIGAPVRADQNDDIATFLGAAAALFIIGKAIEAHNDKPQQKAHAPAQGYKQPKDHGKPQQKYQGHDKPKWGNKDHWDRPNGNRGNAPLPSACIQRSYGGNERYTLSERCLSRNYQSARPLPQSCKTWVEGNRGGMRPAYGLTCLKQKGYRTDQMARR
ncbi:hypothetical protein [Pseudoprimorskyibacter insulae]|uniref:Uncharacterized protein n=1 Tax=Pseudoprimorskyibacter insulae TaxID=1695997 RepID=A0A2R8AUY4_9RHOB|nr:hypothetical protein [Pseudoprimorskyibacter insulae]SPF79826.1 hypothetical protein PRI8871_01625 [Pseudoprimorskyibacter insulae]